MPLQRTNLLIEMGRIPATFQGTPDEFSQVMVKRMRIVSPSGTNFIFIGDVEPSSNVGPWLKGGTQWWVFDETTKRYVPLDISESDTEWFWVGATTPPNSTPAIWLKTTSGTSTDAPVSGQPIGWYQFNGSTWVPFTEIQDRSITQAKLDWTHLFYGTSTGANSYSLSISPSSGFSLGNGIDSTFWAVVKFSASNTGASTLNVNGSGAKPITKLAGNPLVSGDILAGNIYVLVYDGANFQLINPSLNQSPTATIAHGIPTFITPVVVTSSGAAVPFTTYSGLAAAGVPATASAIILQADGGSTESNCFVNVRKASGSPSYVLLRAGAIQAGADQVVTANQGIYPFNVSGAVLSFDYEIPLAFDVDLTIRLVGYIT